MNPYKKKTRNVSSNVFIHFFKSTIQTKYKVRLKYIKYHSLKSDKDR